MTTPGNTCSTNILPLRVDTASSEGPDLFGCFQAHRQSPPPHPASAVLCPAALSAALRPLPSCRAGLARYPHHPSDVPCPLPRRIDRVHMSIASPFTRSFPKFRPGRHPHHHFRGLLRLHSRYGPSDCSTAQGVLCHEASTRPVTRPSRSSTTRPIDYYLSGTFLH